MEKINQTTKLSCNEVSYGSNGGRGMQHTLIPCIRAIARKGLKALKVLIVLNAWIPLAPHNEATKLISDTCFRMKKKQKRNGKKHNITWVLENEHKRKTMRYGTVRYGYL